MAVYVIDFFQFAIATVIFFVKSLMVYAYDSLVMDLFHFAIAPVNFLLSR